MIGRGTGAGGGGGGGAGKSISGTAFEIPPPGSGLKTVIAAVPLSCRSAAESSALKREEPGGQMAVRWHWQRRNMRFRLHSASSLSREEVSMEASFWYGALMGILFSVLSVVGSPIAWACYWGQLGQNFLHHPRRPVIDQPLFTAARSLSFKLDWRYTNCCCVCVSSSG